MSRPKWFNMQSLELFDSKDTTVAGLHVLHGFAIAHAASLLAEISRVAAQSAFRRMITRTGPMSVDMTNCGDLGWVSDLTGYRYSATDPDTGSQWPAMPHTFAALAREAATTAGFADFIPDACLVNRYAPGARMGLHQDRNEHDRSQPIVSVSLGVAAVFQFGGLTRTDPVRRIPIGHGDVLVWGGSVRLAYHGVLPIKPAVHPATGPLRINLTFRRAGVSFRSPTGVE
jgi:DNA oxidative demethylase